MSTFKFCLKRVELISFHPRKSKQVSNGPLSSTPRIQKSSLCPSCGWCTGEVRCNRKSRTDELSRLIYKRIGGALFSLNFLSKRCSNDWCKIYDISNCRVSVHINDVCFVIFPPPNAPFLAIGDLMNHGKPMVK